MILSAVLSIVSPTFPVDFFLTLTFVSGVTTGLYVPRSVVSPVLPAPAPAFGASPVALLPVSPSFLVGVASAFGASPVSPAPAPAFGASPVEPAEASFFSSAFGASPVVLVVVVSPSVFGASPVDSAEASVFSSTFGASPVESAESSFFSSLVSEVAVSSAPFLTSSQGLPVPGIDPPPPVPGVDPPPPVPEPGAPDSSVLVAAVVSPAGVDTTAPSPSVPSAGGGVNDGSDAALSPSLAPSFLSPILSLYFPLASSAFLASLALFLSMK